MNESVKLDFVEFRAEHFDEYRKWFGDPILDKALGDEPDQEWLQHILSDAHGLQLVGMHGDQMVAVVGLVLPSEEHAACVITDLAIRPQKRGQGYGSQVLQYLQETYPPETLRAFVDVKNPLARQFFEKNGWTCLSQEPDRHGMFEMRPRIPAGKS